MEESEINIRAPGLAGILILLAVFSCESPPTNINGGAQDTMWIHVSETRTTGSREPVYRFIAPGNGGEYETTYTLIRPVTADMLSLNHVTGGGVFPIYSMTCVRQFDTVFQGIGAADTVLLSDTVSTIHVERETIDVASSITVDSIERCLRTRPPKFIETESLIAQLSDPFEGRWRQILINAYHFPEDSAEIQMIGAPPWVAFEWRSDWYMRSDHWMYPVCVDGDTVSLTWMVTMSDGIGAVAHRPSLVISPDSTHADSITNWKLVVRNKYGLGDTLNVTTKVQGLPHSCE